MNWYKATKGITRTKAGIKLMALILNIFATVKPVIIVIIPPHALKSAIIVGVVKGIINCANKKHKIKIINCGTHISSWAYPSAAPNKIAVKKSKTD